jgi:hypothetical protein
MCSESRFKNDCDDGGVRNDVLLFYVMSPSRQQTMANPPEVAIAIQPIALIIAVTLG